VNEVIDGSMWRKYLLLPQLCTVRMFVTWQRAAEIMASNVRNRHVRPLKRKQYADLMRRGLWDQNHPDSIAFDARGVMFNGQHRLLGQIDAKVDLQWTFMFGCSEGAKLTVDAHTAKTIGDRLWIAGRGLGVTATDRRRCSEIALRMMHGPSDNKNRPSTEDIAAFIDLHHDAIGFTMQVFGSKTRGRITTSPVRAVVARAYYHVALERLRRFVEVLLSGEADLSHSSTYERAITLGRNWLILEARNSNSAGETYRRVARALLAYVNNEPIKQLKDISYDPFPLPQPGSSSEADLGTDRISRAAGQFGTGGQSALGLA
jgi:hypothetical protein